MAQTLRKKCSGAQAGDDNALGFAQWLGREHWTPAECCCSGSEHQLASQGSSRIREGLPYKGCSESARLDLSLAPRRASGADNQAASVDRITSFSPFLVLFFVHRVFSSGGSDLLDGSPIFLCQILRLVTSLQRGPHSTSGNRSSLEVARVSGSWVHQSLVEAQRAGGRKWEGEAHGGR